ncbi:CoA ligase, possible involved in capsular antigen synthesis (related to CapK protein) [Aromatoleum aromaticum EbN1]|uniref:CoA ligase, possible involved in capsular antigen synthesis (Related to CapK protein) n=2 Tax=Aromatoleum aromaticum TaxID=551760 RepID=Q5P294_AROAE|nr:CoA ligase, possible involved in capsular antigen synthesis (related to CapK protein) [Aromatoleum aromaticum EbN1]
MSQRRAEAFGQPLVPHVSHTIPFMTLYPKIVSTLLFPLHEHFKGHDTPGILRELERSQWYSQDHLADLQMARLRNMLVAVSNSVPFYRKHFRANGLTIADFVTRDGLNALPLIDKNVIRSNFDEWKAEDGGALARHSTSGSSGEPLSFLLGSHRISFDIAAKWRATRWWDVDIGDREMVLWSSPLEIGAQDRLRALRDRLFRSRLVPARDLSPDRIDRILADIRTFRPRMLFGYPSALSRIAFRARERSLRMDDVGIRVAFCTSEVLRPEWREAIGQVFGCGVANEYGARDAGFIARECQHGGLHVTAEEVIVEVVDDDGKRLQPGTEGDIVITNFAGPEFPFIRYRTGDRGVLSDARCACGRGLPLIQSISGRTNDGLVAADGSWVHGSAINHALRELRDLEAYRIVQESRQYIRITLATRTPLPDAVRSALTRHVHTLLGASVQVEIAQLPEIPPEPNGKFRHIICNVERGQSEPTDNVGAQENL